VLGKLENLSLREIAMIAELPRFSSLRALSRSRDIEVAQVTRALQRIELHLGFQILERSHAGIAMTREGERVAAAALKVLEAAQDLTSSEGAREAVQTLTVGTRGFLNYVFAPLLFAAQRHVHNQRLSADAVRDFRFRFLDMSPEELKVAEHKRLIQIAIHLDQVEWTKSWESYFVGNLRWGAFVRPGHPLLSQYASGSEGIQPEELIDAEFVGPCYWMGSEIQEGDDGFPLPLRKRHIGVQVQSAMTGIELARTSDAVVFVPNIVSSQFVHHGMIARLPIGNTEKCFQPVYLSVRTDAVTKRLVDYVMETMRQALD
jgi:DNA-binding transcriptional LysR family regulator